MRQSWTIDELTDHWTLLPVEQDVLGTSKDTNRLGLAVMLKAYGLEGRFPYNISEVPEVVVDYVARQAGVEATLFGQYDWRGRSSSSHRTLIREHFGFRVFAEADVPALTSWLREHAVPQEERPEVLKELALTYLRAQRVEPPSTLKLERHVASAQRTFETHLCERVFGRLLEEFRVRLDEVVRATVQEDEPEDEDDLSARTSLIHWLRSDSNKPGLESVEEQVAKLRRLRAVGLPKEALHGVLPAALRRYRERTGVEAPSELRAHPEAIRATQLAAFCLLREAELTDSLVDHLIHTVHSIGARAERRVDKRLLEEFKRVENKTAILFRLVEAALANPDGRVRDVLFPVVGEEKLRHLLKEFKANHAGVYQREVHATLRASYRNHYRRMIPWLLGP